MIPPTINFPSGIVNGITLSADSSNGVLLEDNYQVAGRSWWTHYGSIDATDNVEVETLTSIHYPDGANSDYFGYGRVWVSHDLTGGTDFPGVWCGNNGMLKGIEYVPIGTTTINCAAMDRSGNIGTASFTITVNPPQYLSLIHI